MRLSRSRCATPRVCLFATAGLRGLVLLGLTMLSWFVPVGSQAAGDPAQPATTDAWTRFRGPNGSGLSSATTIPNHWTDDDYNWRIKLPGIGHASPVVWNDKVYIHSADEEAAQRIVQARSTTDGSLVWERRYPLNVHHKHLQNSYASSTPAVDALGVYLCWSSPEEYVLLALDHQGSDRWQLNLGPFKSQHSSGTSPIVYRDMVILNNDQDGESFLLAVRCHDGSEVWRSERKTIGVAYSTPCVLALPGQSDQLIFNSEGHGISSLDPFTGKVNWEHEAFDKRTVASPIVSDGLVFGSCGSGGGGNYVVALRPGTEPEVAYQVTTQAPYVPTIVAKDDMLFLWSDKGIVACLDLPTGDVHWRQRIGGNFSGSPIWVNGYLYCVSAKGEVSVLSAAKEFQKPFTIALGEECRSTPAVADGRMYLRTCSQLFSLGGQPLTDAPRTANK